MKTPETNSYTRIKDGLFTVLNPDDLVPIQGIIDRLPERDREIHQTAGNVGLALVSVGKTRLALLRSREGEYSLIDTETGYGEPIADDILTVGRSGDNDFALPDDETVSRKHVTVRLERSKTLPLRISFEDENSTNGTNIYYNKREK